MKTVIRGPEEDDGPKAPPIHSGPAPETPILPHPRIWLDKVALEQLQKKIAARSPTWITLDAKCKSRMEGPVEWPDGKDYPNPGIGEGYQGGEYWEAVLDLALCSRALRSIDPARSKAVAARAADVLEKMSDVEGPHAVNPLRDDGFGVRFFPTAMAIGYDWLDGDLSPELKAKLRTAITHWIETFDAKGFARNHPQGNYFAGYYNAKALAALATQGDFDKSPTWWKDWHERLHLKMVQPYYAKYMAGGGWPEGWNYGAFATVNMTWPVWAATTAKGEDLFRDKRAPYTFPFDQAVHLVHFAWPDRIHMEDRGMLYDGSFDEVAPSPIWPLTVLPEILRREGDAFAPHLQRQAREVRERRKKKGPAWMDFLFWDETAPEADYANLQRSFVAWGMQTAAVRSSWEEDAVWAGFTSGTHVNNPDSGEMWFDQGGLSIVRGNRPFLVNATGHIRRLGPGENEPRGDDPVYEDLRGNHDKDPTKGNRTLFNIFYARQKPPADRPEPDERYGQIAAAPPKPKTHIGRFEDKDAWVLMRGEKLEDMYRRGKKNEVRVASWTRQVLYVRPSLFVIDDHTEVTDADLDQWVAFHLAYPAAPRSNEPSVFDVGTPDKLAGTLAVVFPKGAPLKTVDVFGRKKVMRVEVRPAKADKAQRWLTVLDAAPPGPGATKVRAIESEAGAVGALIEAPASGERGAVAVVSSEGGKVSYRAPLGATHYLTSLAPKQDVKVVATREGTTITISVDRGSALRASEGGVVAFRVDEGGAIVPLPGK